MKVVFKVLLFVLVTAIVLAVAALFGMPGARDGELHLAGRYYFTHSGGFQNSITEERDGLSEFVIHMKVEEFVIQGNDILVTRRPVILEKSAENVHSEQRLSDTCEYYRIDVSEGKVYGPFALAEVQGRAEWALLNQRQGDQDFGDTMCKLAAIFVQPVT